MTATSPWVPPAARTVVVAPHPDDEVLGAGGLIALQRARACEVLVVAVTDGEAAAGAPDAGLAAIRRDEQLAGLRELGVGAADVVRLGLPDGAVAAHEAALGRVLCGLLAPGDLLVAPWVGDHHTDHETTGRAAVAAAAERRVAAIGFLVWAPARAASRLRAAGPLLQLALTAEIVDRRRAAIGQHRSQLHGGIDAVVGAELLPRFDEAVERFVGSRPGGQP